MEQEIKYSLKPNKKQLKAMKEGWKQLQKDEEKFWEMVQATEKWMQKETGITDLEFFKVDGEFVGIGNESRSMKLIQSLN